MTMRRLMEELQAVQQPLMEADDTMADEGDEADGEELEPEEPNAAVGDDETEAADAFAGWDEGMAVVATVDTTAFGEDESEYEIPAETTAEIVGVALDSDPPGAVLMLEDGLAVAIPAESAADWSLVADEGADEDEGEESEDEDDGEMEGEDEPEDDDAMGEAHDPLIGELRALIQEARGKGKKGDKGKGKGKKDAACCGCAGKGVAEAVEDGEEDVLPEPQQAALGLALVLLAGDAFGPLDGGEFANPDVAKRALRYQQSIAPKLRAAGIAPSAVQRIAAKAYPKVVAALHAVLGAGK